MGERFAILNTEAPSKKSRGEHTQENSKGNIFKQKPKPGASSRALNGLNHETNRNRNGNGNGNGNTRTRNTFASRRIAKEPEFNVAQCSFPVLIESTVTVRDTSGDSYKEKIQKTKEENQVNATVPTGWTVLTNKRLSQQRATGEMEQNPYYNPRIAKLIMEDRQNYREELNDILGDISPYWNMDIEAEDNEQDYDVTRYSEEEDDYVEDW